MVVADEASSSKLDGKESKLPGMTESMIEKWEAKANEQLDLVIDDEIFRSELKSQVSDLKWIEEDVENLKSLIKKASQALAGIIRRNNQAPEDGAVSGAKEDTMSETESEIDVKGLECSNEECFLCLSVFPENVAIKKRPLIYWWIGEGLVAEKKEADGRTTTTAEEAGEKVFEELLEKGYIAPSSSSSFTVYPSVRRKLTEFTPTPPPNGHRRRALLKLGNKHSDVGDGNEKENPLVTVFNVDEQYLGREAESVLLKERRKLKVVQMGRWQSSAIHHIEAAEDYKKLLGSLASQKQLKYLSLRGISRIEALPESIERLTTLQILDLRACHNLEQLQGISKLKKLTHLDVSECYLLDRMPKGLNNLTKLQVLKGFVVSNSCKISDLAQLPALRKLSIRVGEQGQEQLKSLGSLSSIKILTISWGVVSSPKSEVSLPTNLIKLDLRAVPFDTLPTWLQPSQREITNLKKLYIKGGKLKNLNHHDYPNLTFLRVNYLKDLDQSPPSTRLITI